MRQAVRKAAARAAPFAVCAAFSAAPAAAHPHVFVDGEVGFVLDSEGRVSAVRIVWLFDPFYSLLLLGEFGLDPAAAPDAAGLAALAGLRDEWARDFGGDGVVSVDGAPVPLADATAVSAAVEDGRIRLSFERALTMPPDPRAGRVDAALYDPSFFVAYTLTGAHVAAAGCSAAVRPFDADAELDALRGTLFTLGPDETPSDPDVGRLFADKAALTCG